MPDARHVRRIEITSVLTAALAAWLIISPWALTMPPSRFSLNLVVIGSLVLADSALRLQFGRKSVFAWINATLGAWLVISPNVLEHSTNGLQTWNCILVGAAIAAIAATGITWRAVRRASAAWRAGELRRMKH